LTTFALKASTVRLGQKVVEASLSAPWPCITAIEQCVALGGIRFSMRWEPPLSTAANAKFHLVRKSSAPFTPDHARVGSTARTGAVRMIQSGDAACSFLKQTGGYVLIAA